MVNGDTHNNTLNNVQAYNNAYRGIEMNNSNNNILNNIQSYNNVYGIEDG
ncbi:MAG: hypothetical protein WCJ45_01135 [bacterium]